MQNLIGFEKSIIDKLKESGLIDKFSIYELKQTPNLEEVIRIFEKPSLIDFDDGGLYYFDENNEKRYCPEMYSSISEKGAWLSDLIPTIEFDINQNGNVRKADEAEALFCSLVVAQILKEKEFKNEIRNLAKSYDFKEMKEIGSSGNSFRSILSSWQDLQSEVINILVSACKYKISDFKKDVEKFLRDGISESEAAELRDLESRIRAINFDYSEGSLSPTNVKKLNKIQRLQLIDERDTKISNLIVESSAGTLYRIMNLSSEYISPLKKKKISLWVQREVDLLLSTEPYKDMQEERSQLLAKFTRRALRFEKNSVRKVNIEKYIENRQNFKIPSKL